MFLKLPFILTHNLQQTALVLNTVLLIAALVVFELVYSEQPKEKRNELKYFGPIIVVLVGLLIYAAYKQTGNA
jgi:hypothetical protein